LIVVRSCNIAAPTRFFKMHIPARRPSGGFAVKTAVLPFFKPPRRAPHASGGRLRLTGA